MHAQVDLPLNVGNYNLQGLCSCALILCGVQRLKAYSFYLYFGYV